MFQTSLDQRERFMGTLQIFFPAAFEQEILRLLSLNFAFLLDPFRFALEEFPAAPIRNEKRKRQYDTPVPMHRDTQTPCSTIFFHGAHYTVF